MGSRIDGLGADSSPPSHQSVPQFVNHNAGEDNGSESDVAAAVSGALMSLGFGVPDEER